MSVRILGRVWDGFPDGGSELLAMLALADWSDDAGKCWPSVPSIARKVRLSPDQARRVVHRLIRAGYITVTEGNSGGGTSRRYQINLDLLTPCMDATPSIGARGCAGATPPLAPAQGDPLHSYASRTVIEPSLKPSIPRDAKKPHRLGDSVPAFFPEFWNAYDKKTGKQNSIAAWKKIRPSAELAQQIIAAAKAYSARREQTYRKDPERWLKGRMWEDAQAGDEKPDWLAGAV